MSTGKRIAKRSIQGTRVVAPGIDGRFYPAVIKSTKQYSGGGGKVQDCSRYVVQFDNSRKVCEFAESELVGPGFAGVSAIGSLLTGQRVYLTHAGREIEGTVGQHDVKADLVAVNLSIGGQLAVRREEIRLLESRKSTRLMDRHTTVQDFSKMAELGLLQERRKQTERRRLNSEISSNSDSSDIFSSRKRRGSETVSEEGEGGSSSEESFKRSSNGSTNDSGRVVCRGEGKSSRTDYQQRGRWPKLKGRRPVVECGGANTPRRGSSPIMSECTAAMVLMDLHGSPASRSSHLSGHSDGSSGQMSPSSSGVSSLGSSWNSPTLTPPFPLPSVTPPYSLAPPTPPSPSATVTTTATAVAATSAADCSPVSALLELSGDLCTAGKSDSDEGIVSDQSSEFDDKRRIQTDTVRTIFQCTWRACLHQETQCHLIERHVRQVHLGRSDPVTEEEDDREEEFYYTEFELPDQRRQREPPACTQPDKAAMAVVSADDIVITTAGRHSNEADADADEEELEEDEFDDAEMPQHNKLTEDCLVQPMHHNHVAGVVAADHLVMPLGVPTPTATPTPPVGCLPTHYSQTTSVFNSEMPPAAMFPPSPSSSSSSSSLSSSAGLAPISRGRVGQTLPNQQQAHQQLQHHQQQQQQQVVPLLADHCDMARPPHENPEYTSAPNTGCAQMLSSSSPTYATIISPTSSLGLPLAIPITTFTISGGSSGGGVSSAASGAGVPGKYIRLSPKPSCPSTSPKSPVRRPRGDAKKCRKVYGMDQRDLWCTQCKWKKACTRFGEAQPT